MIEITIDGKKIEARPGDTVLRAALAHKIPIPHLCFHPALKPSGGCHVCGVEVDAGPDKRVVTLSCLLKVKEGLKVKTGSELVAAHRKKAFDRLLSLAPDSVRIRELAQKFNVPVAPRPDGCIRCRLCVRVCSEIVKVGAIKMIKTDTGSRVGPGEGTCIGCGTCANLCPTRLIRVRDQDNVRTITIGDEVLSRLPLEMCEACGRSYATRPFLDHMDDTSKEHPHTRETHHFCPSCAKLMSTRTRTEDEHLKK